MTVRSDITLEDYLAYLKFTGAKLTRGTKKSRRYSANSFVAIMVLIVAGAIIGIIKPEWEQRIWFIALGVFIGFGLYMFLMLSARKVQMKLIDPLEDGAILGERELEVTEEGLRSRSRTSEGFYGWSIIAPPDVEKDHIYIWVDRMAALIVPRRSFATPADEKRFLDLIAARAQRTGN